MAYPSTVGSYSNPNATDRLNSPAHHTVETNQNTEILAVQTFVGTLSSVAGTLMYDVRAAASNGGGHVQTAVKGGTGQTIFSKGDILVAQSSSTISKLAVGSDGAALVADSTTNVGIKWKTNQVTITSFLSSGVWTKPTGLSYVEVEVWGGGGSGGRNNNAAGGGGGGGGGGYSFARFATSVLGATESINVGASVVGRSTDGNGTGGNLSVFGTSSLLTAYGGGGGGGNSGGTPGAGGGGGGLLSAGSNASGGGWGPGGRPSTSIFGAFADNSMGGANGSNDASNAGNAGWGGGGGGSAATPGGFGGNSLMGGGGGGGAGNNTNAGGAGGTSKLGGAGGLGGGNTTPVSGTQPAGGGGGAFDETSGGGAAGKVIIYEHY